MEEELSTSVSMERIVAFEKKKNEKKQSEKQSFIFRIVIFSLILVSLCIAPFLPVFSARNSTLQGTHLLSMEEVLSYGNYKRSTPLLFINAEKLEKEIEKKEYIESCSVSWKFFGLEMHVNEIAVVLKKEESGQMSYYLSNDKMLDEFKSEHPLSTYDFKEEDVPLVISDLSFKTKVGDKEVEDVDRRKKLFGHLKEISPDILKEAIYFEVLYSKNKEHLLFAFYFLGENQTYNRLLLRDETFSYFLEPSRLEKIKANIRWNIKNNVGEDKKTNVIYYNHDTISELRYTNTVCTYDGKENKCLLSTR